MAEDMVFKNLDLMVVCGLDVALVKVFMEVTSSAPVCMAVDLLEARWVTDTALDSVLEAGLGFTEVNGLFIWL